MSLPAAAPRLARPAVYRALAMTGLALAVAGVHFRPWTRGLLEDLQFAFLYAQGGETAFITAVMPGLAGRPLHLLAATVGLAVSDGGYVGMWLVMGLVTGAQVVVVVWALRPLVPSFVLRLGLAAVIGFHAWWPAGDILRFMPAQVGVLVFLCWLGVALRHVARPRWMTGVLLLVLPALGMLTYQAFAVLYPLAIVVIAVIAGQPLRRVVGAGILSAIGLVGALGYSVVVVPLLFPNAYESGLVGAGGGLAGALPAILRTLSTFAGGVLISALLLVVALLVLLATRRIAVRDGVLVAALVVASPFAAFVYASEALHLNDPERVALPAGGVLWLAAVVLVARVTWSTVPARSVAAALVAASLIAAIPALVTWQRYADVQEQLIAAVEPIAETTAADDRILVVDHSGVFGDVYTLLSPALDFALYVDTEKYVATSICTPEGTVRQHEVAQRYPIGTTPDCSTLDVEPLSTTTVEVPAGMIDIIVYEAPTS